MPSESEVTAPPGARGTTPATARSTYRRLRLAGLSAREAGSLAGHLQGLRVVPGGWAIEEVERLLFVRALVRLGRMGS